MNIIEYYELENQLKQWSKLSGSERKDILKFKFIKIMYSNKYKNTKEYRNNIIKYINNDIIDYIYEYKYINLLDIIMYELTSIQKFDMIEYIINKNNEYNYILCNSKSLLFVIIIVRYRKYELAKLLLRWIEIPIDINGYYMPYDIDCGILDKSMYGLMFKYLINDKQIELLKEIFTRFPILISKFEPFLRYSNTIPITDTHKELLIYLYNSDDLIF